MSESMDKCAICHKNPLFLFTISYSNPFAKDRSISIVVCEKHLSQEIIEKIEGEYQIKYPDKTVCSSMIP